MHRTVTFLLVGLVSGFALTGCPDKKAEKEPPAVEDDPATAEDQGADDDQADEEAADQKKPDPKKADSDDKDEGGW